MRRKIAVGSRGSRLALVQAQSVVSLIKEMLPDAEVSLVTMVTQGDRNPHVSLDHMERMGVFVKELEEALLDHRIDLAVHSLKDVPTEIPDGLVLSAVLEREDPRDVLVTRGEKLAQLPPGARIGTGSLRRAVQLAALRRDVEACGIRGNVDTRLRKVASGEVSGVILAAAAMNRLGWPDRVTEYLPAEHFLPAVGQGALVIETRTDDSEINSMASRLNHVPTWQCVTAERAFLLELGGGCRAPIAALGTVEGGSLRLEGMIGSPSTGKMLRQHDEGPVDGAAEIGRGLARRLLAAGGVEFVREIGCR